MTFFVRTMMNIHNLPVFKRAIYLPCTLVNFTFNIFSIFVKMAKNPHVVRKFKVANTSDAKEVKFTTIIQESLLEQLQVCTVTSSIQICCTSVIFI